ncbi:MAG: hypothetical protein WDN25_08620 [Acetobacteraceae bacterium]
MNDPQPGSNAANSLFRPRRRPALRRAVGGVLAAVAIVAAGMVVWLRSTIVPPDCHDAATLALLHRQLTDRFGPPATVTIEHVHTLAGGYLAFRFACEADVGGIDPNDLPPATPVPGSVDYVSQRDADGRQVVTISVRPRLRLAPVQGP